ncbi:MAG: PAS domain S-box protein, partial [Anaerolineae bacterium]
IAGEVAGSLSLGTLAPRRFSRQEIALVQSVADQMAGVLAQARLAQRHQLLSTAIEQASETVLITDVNDNIIYVNPAFERVTGYSPAEVIGRSPHFLASGKHDEAFFQEMRDTINAGQVWRGRVTNKKKDGTLFTEDVTISPIRGKNGEVVNFVEVKRDVTRELELEEQYHQAQKMESIGLLAGGIAHDFNNLLTAINGFAKLLQYELPPSDPRQEMVEKILQAGQRAADLIRQLLAFSRKQIIAPRVLNLNTVVAEMDKMLRRILGEDIVLEIRLAPDLWPLIADPAQMEQVIINLAVNAHDAMPDGGQLTIETANVVLNETHVANHLELLPGDYVRLTVNDTGLGMSEEVLTRIFEPFFTTKEVGKGTGLGLATVFGIVKQNRGDIQVYSWERQGTTFRIYLPRAEDAAAASNRSRQADRIPGGAETVLLVEDDSSVRELASRVLAGQGYTVLEAANGEEALRLAREHNGQIHLLLTDVVMPHMGGKELADRFRVARPQTRVLYASGHTDEAIARRGVLEPEMAFIQKPFSPTALARKVREVLDQ